MDFGIRAWSWVSDFGFWGLGFSVYSFGFVAVDLWSEVCGFEIRVWGLDL